MRSTTAYYVLLLYITVMLRPLLPYIEDTFSHTFSETIHIATVHAQYGSNHLEKELVNNSDNANGKHHTAANFEEQVPVHISANEYIYNTACKLTDNTYPFLNLHRLKNGFIIKFSPPPKIS